ncbi:MAG: FAD-dependent monooxygenase [Sandaracinaceae bacterium]|nr:FAD-dependent monooxygenase [Myxococcales bacterium]MCB9657854.1 FAD-dependent monooxygenase [Sandaracinaceae bacterium]
MRVGINGIGIGGPTLAYWLKRYGHEPVLFEKADALRAEGFVVDFWGLGYQVAEKMGIVERLRAKGKEMNRLSFVADDGHEVAGLDTTEVRQRWNNRFITVPRGVICEELFKACEGVEARFGTHIVGLDEDADRVSATLSDGTHEDFDAVVGADGLHSAIRGLVFGPEDEFESFLDCYVAVFRAPNYPNTDEGKYLAHSIPNRWAARIQRYDGTTVILLIFRASLLDQEPHSQDDVRRCLREVYADVKWEVPEMLCYLDEGPVYFDRISQIRMPTWSKGRVALLGDAAACASLLAGEGTGLAMTEAYVLAGELHRSGGDVALAYRRYEDKLAKFVRREQDHAKTFRMFFAPASRAAVWTRDLLIKMAGLPGMTGFVAGQSVPAFEFDDYGP